VQPKAIRGSRTPPPRPSGATIQLASVPNSTTVNDITGVFWNWSYPIGSSKGLLAKTTDEKYAVGAKVYDDDGDVIGKGEYENDAHAELNALEDALRRGYSLGDVAVIKVTKGCCRRCAVIMKMLGLADKAGPKSSSPCTGAYVIPTRVRNALAAKLTKFDIDDMAWVISNGQWW
jgi:pyrimidine deaminase RibD-like protein